MHYERFKTFVANIGNVKKEDNLIVQTWSKWVKAAHPGVAQQNCWHFAESKRWHLIINEIGGVMIAMFAVSKVYD